jgi:hypothetical protein
VKVHKKRFAEVELIEGDAESDDHGIPEIQFDEKEDQPPALVHFF